MFKLIKKKLRSNIYTEHIMQVFKNLFYVAFNKNNPFGHNPIATEDKYMNILANSKKINYLDINLFEKVNNFKIDINWFYNLALHTQVTIKESEICFQHGRLLYTSVRKYLANKNINNNTNIVILETGTARGFSSLCMAKALDDSGFSGIIHTIDILPHDKLIYWNVIDDVKGKKSRSDLLLQWKNLTDKYIRFHEGTSHKIIDKLNLNRVNFSFLDASHTFFDVKKEFIKITNSQIKDDVIIFDDYSKNSYNGVIKAANYLTDKYDYKNEYIEANNSRGYLISTKN